MKRLLQAGCLVVAVGLAWISRSADIAAGIKDPSRATAVRLYESLNAEQKKQILLPYDSKDRYVEIFPAAKRPGLPISALNAEQKKLVEEILRNMTSTYGAERCIQVAKQTGENLRFITFYGEPSGETPFAWRVATHHLTLVYVEFGKEKSNEFGPILLGGNPVKDLWDEEDKIAVELYAALMPEEIKNLGTKAGKGSGGPIGKGGMRVGDLNEKAKKLATKLFEKRLDVFSPDRRKQMDAILKEEGGVDNLRLAVWGNMGKSFKTGNNYAWRIGNDRITCDWETIGKEHLHLSIKAKKGA